MAVLGGSLKRRERISARLGDVLSQIFPASAVLKRYDDEGRQEADLPLVHWGVQDAMYQAEQAIDDLLANFPNRFVAGALRVVIFPTGRHHRAVRQAGSQGSEDPSGSERNPLSYWSGSISGTYPA